jgi:hypothetical protein
MSDIYDEPTNDAQELAITDPDDLHRVRRVEAIHEARKRFVEVRLKAREAMDSDPMFHKYRKDRLAVLTALDYLRELEPMIRRSDSDILKREITIAGKLIPESELPNDAHDTADNRRVESVTLTTEDLLDSGGEVNMTHEMTGYDHMRQHRVKHEIAVSLNPEEKHAMRIVRLCDDFIEDVLPSISSGDGEADFDYSDLL